MSVRNGRSSLLVSMDACQLAMAKLCTIFALCYSNLAPVRGASGEQAISESVDLGESAMSDYSYVNILKRRAKSLAREEAIPLAAAHERVSAAAGFADFHELSVVAKRSPDDSRLMKAALGISVLVDTIYEDDVYSAFESEVEESLSDAVGETNASDFTIEGLAFSDSVYDPLNGVLTLHVSFSYEGDQDLDRMYHGCAFYLDALIRLVLRDDEWRFADDGLEILAGESDKDRDHQMELNDQYAHWLEARKV